MTLPARPPGPRGAASPLGRHLLVELYACASGVLDDPALVRELLESAARDGGCRVVESVLHRFEPQGVTGVVVLAESHLSIHTWPELGCATLDLFTCAPGTDLDRVLEEIRRGLRAGRVERRLLARGDRP